MNNIHAERVESRDFGCSSMLSFRNSSSPSHHSLLRITPPPPPHRATTLFSTSPPLSPLSSSPSHHSLSLPFNAPPTSSSAWFHDPSSHGLTVSSSSVVASLHSQCMMLKRSSVSSLLTSTFTSILQGLFLFLINWYFTIKQLIMIV